MSDPQPFLRLVIAISATGGSVSSLEYLSLGACFRGEGPFSSELSRLRRPMRGHLRSAEFVFGWPGVIVLLVLRGLSAAGCIAYAMIGPVPIALLAVYAGAGALLALRSGFLLDGAERMLLITAVACLLAAVCPSQIGKASALFFLAVQLSMAYGTAGLLKCARPEWRSGESLTALLSTRMFGRPRVHRLLGEWKVPMRGVSRAVIFGEILASLAPWSPPGAAAILLAGAAAFHAAAAGMMGLNTFLFAFPALFPAAVYVSESLYR